MDTYTVRVTREDGSVTFRGNRMAPRRAERERAAWVGAGFGAEIVSERTVRAEVAAWRRATRGGGRFFPQSV